MSIEFTSEFTSGILRRLDGTYVVQRNGVPYHVCSREIDPHNAYDLAEVDAWATAHPDMVDVETSGDVVAAVAESLCAAMSLDARLLYGFIYDGVRYQSDQKVREVWLVNTLALERGDTSVLPVRIRDAGNTNHEMSAAEFAPFVAAAFAAVSQIERDFHAAKDAVRAAATAAAAQSQYDAWLASWG